MVKREKMKRKKNIQRKLEENARNGTSEQNIKKKIKK